MAGASLLALLDDIATLLDDVALMTKVAAKKTAGVLGDDLALNAQQVAGVRAERELPVVWAVAKGSFLNKAILIPAALFISAIFPKAIIPLLMLGGLYLCFEGVEKVAHTLKQRLKHPTPEQAEHEQALEALADPAVDLGTFEKTRIKGAIRTDFVLSTEIIVITLGMVAKLGLIEQLCVLVSVGLLMTVGVYGMVAGIVKLDDLGACLYRKNNRFGKKVGKALLLVAPRLMGLLSIVGTLAMFMVGGGIITEHITNLHHLAEQIAASVGPAGFLGEILVHVVVGFIAGTVALAAWTLINRLKKHAKG